MMSITQSHQRFYPKKEVYEAILQKIFDKNELVWTDNKYKIKGYEDNKSIGKKYPHWLHVHCMVKTRGKRNIDYKEYANLEKGYSINFKKCRNIQDVLTYSGYCVKCQVAELTPPEEHKKKERVYTKSILDYIYNNKEVNKGTITTTH